MGEKSVKYYAAAIATLLLMFVIGIVYVGEDVGRMQMFLGLLAVVVSVFTIFCFLRLRGRGVMERRYFHTAAVMTGFAWAVFALYSINIL